MSDRATRPDRTKLRFKKELTDDARLAICQKAELFMSRQGNRLTAEQALEMAAFQAFQAWYWQTIGKPRHDAARARAKAKRSEERHQLEGGTT